MTTPRRRLVIALAFLLPNLLGFIVFTAGPVLFSLAMSFTDWALTKHNRFSDTPVQYIGLHNFHRILTGDESHLFWDYFANTAFLMLGIPIGIAGSLALALMLNAQVTPQSRRGRMRSATLAALITIFAVLGVWLLTMPMADSLTPMKSAETGLTDLSIHQVATLRSHAAVLFAAAAGIIATCGIAFGAMFFRGLFYLPSLLAGVAMYLLWKALYRPEGGLINAGLRPILSALKTIVESTPAALWMGAGIVIAAATVGACAHALLRGIERLRYRDSGPAAFIGRLALIATIAATGLAIALVIARLPRASFDAPLWLVDSRWAKTALIIMGIWAGLGGGTMILYLAGLSNIPPELYEAAAIDGATGWQRFINITWPQLAPTTFFIVIMSTIGGLQGGFEQAMVMTQGKADTIVLAYYIYNIAFTDQFQLGLASAVAWIMFIMIFAMTALNFRLGSQLTNE